ncbi:glycosyltransferase family 2 protein [Dyadobacter luticola]|uniref:Glycosyltransferase family 2 protein n=1 Tax=Dyadobacter luticola TaxID=1979387 RepID=A0A5R9L3R9_9BACT|nr:glycosyltransferase family 2 protein [Dyadobacter luticola]TLV03224.1 glycosyltransferase family 2 protein [Dyadobacter luticola]
MKFSIGIPAYKASFLRECIDSILGQTEQDFELIIVNDASPQNIEEIVLGYNSPKIRYYKNDKNFGALNVVDNWNKCLSYATGEYFILMGDDDKMCPDYLEEFSKLITKFPACNIYHCRTLVINESSEPQWLTEPRPEFESVYDSVLERMKANRIFFISDYVYRTETLNRNGGFFKLPLAWASDDISAYIGAMENGIAHTNKPVFMYRQSRQTISTSGSVDLKMNAIMEEHQWLMKFTERNPENPTDQILLKNIKKELRKFIQKKKIRTIYTSPESLFSSAPKWFGLRKKYNLKIDELLYAFLLSFREKRKYKYEQ